jgi:hypothetical protein
VKTFGQPRSRKIVCIRSKRAESLTFEKGWIGSLFNRLKCFDTLQACLLKAIIGERRLKAGPHLF